MRDDKVPATAAIRILREKGISFVPHPYRYINHGGAKAASRELHIETHRAVKTLVMEDEEANPLIILMHGDREVSTKALARILGVRSVQPCTPETAQCHTGYVVGGTSPFGTRKRLPVFMEKSILDLPMIFINGGRRGLLIEMDPRDMFNVLDPILVEVAY